MEAQQWVKLTGTNKPCGLAARVVSFIFNYKICIPVVIAEGPHPFPFRTRKLSPPAPMVLRGRPRGRVGRRRDFFMVFIGIDLAWSERNKSGIALIEKRDVYILTRQGYLGSDEEIIDFISRYKDKKGCIISIDAPLIAPNPPGTTRKADREVSRDFARYKATTYPANRIRAKRPINLVKKLLSLGFNPSPNFLPLTITHQIIEVYPHAACVSLFHLPRIVSYKKGGVRQRQKGLASYQHLLFSELSKLNPPLYFELNIEKALFLIDPHKLKGKSLKQFEDQLDAILCAYIGLYCWYWGREKVRIYGNIKEGYIMVPFT